MARRDVAVYAVTFESPERVRAYRQREQLAFPILRDPRRDAYRAFGLARGAREALGARTVGYYARQALRGRLPRLASSDWRQLGGDALLDRRGNVCWVYRSREPADRPAIAELLAAIDRDCG